MLNALLIGMVALTRAFDVALYEQTPYSEARTVYSGDQTPPYADGPSLVEFPDGRLFCAWSVTSADGGAGPGIAASVLSKGAPMWSPPRVIAAPSGATTLTNPVLYFDHHKTLWLFYRAVDDAPDASTLEVATSVDGGYTWTSRGGVAGQHGLAPGGCPLVLQEGVLLLPVYDGQDGAARVLSSSDEAATWTLSGLIGQGGPPHAPVLLDQADGRVASYLSGVPGRYRARVGFSRDGGRSWSVPIECAFPASDTPLAMIRLTGGGAALVLNPVPGGRSQLSLWASSNGGESWSAFRILEDEAEAWAPALIQGRDGLVHVAYRVSGGIIKHVTVNEAWMWEHALIHSNLDLANLVSPLLPPAASPQLPIRVPPFAEHVRGFVLGAPEEGITDIRVAETGELLFRTDPAAALKDGSRVNALVEAGGLIWYGTDTGLYALAVDDDIGVRQDAYGVDGPLASKVTALAVDSHGTLWVGTPLGLSLLDADKTWRHILGRDGLPVEDVTALAIDEFDRVWIGTSRGAILHVPGADGRQWFYRAGTRYLPGDCIKAIALAPSGTPVYFLTDSGIGRLDMVTITLEEKARIIENRVNERHRRMGLVAECVLDDPYAPTVHTIQDNDNDGLWTAYHVAAMSLCYGATGGDAAKASARESMHALYMLQNASGTPGLVARSVVPAAEGQEKDAQWRPTPDGALYWKSDTSSDEIDGHYLAFYTYYEHIARFDSEERDLLIGQVRALTDYIVDNGYQLIDWDGERTRWGFWDPKSLNEDPENYIENGLNSLQMLSFLKVAHYITGDAKYYWHYSRLITEHGYLNNVLLEKKVFPDEKNHSDDQLGFVAWYPILRLERDPRVRDALIAAVRRHYEIVRPENPSFYTFVYATVDPAGAELESAIENLRQIPTNRRNYRMTNSVRDDIAWADRPNRFGRRVLNRVLPADERHFAKWNGDPYEPDTGGNGCQEDDGAAYVLPYWMARYHGFIAGDEVQATPE